VSLGSNSGKFVKASIIAHIRKIAYHINPIKVFLLVKFFKLFSCKNETIAYSNTVLIVTLPDLHAKLNI